MERRITMEVEWDNATGSVTLLDRTTIVPTWDPGNQVHLFFYSFDGSFAGITDAFFLTIDDDFDGTGFNTDPEIDAIQIVNALPNKPPSATTDDKEVNEGSSVTLTATGSDPDGDPLTYAWDLDDDGIFETPGQSVSFLGIDGLASPTSHPVAVRVTDPLGLTGEAEAVVLVFNVPPTITSLSAPSLLQIGEEFSIEALFTEPGLLDTHTVQCNWGDGTSSACDVEEIPGSGSTTGTHAYTEPGTYTIEVTVIDKDGGKDQETISVFVNAPPECAVDPGPTLAVFAGQSISFTVTGTDPDAGDNLTLASSDLPPGATAAPALPASGTSGVSSTITWTPTAADRGTHTIDFTVTDPSDITATCPVTIEVLNNPPVCEGAVASMPNLWPPNHKMVDIGILNVTDPDGDLVTITITQITQDEPIDTFGDGSFVPDGGGLNTSTAQVRAERSGTKKVPGDGRVYEIHFTAEDGQGGQCAISDPSVTVCVPHDQGKKSECVDNGQFYDSVTGDGPAAKRVTTLDYSQLEVKNYPNPFNPSTTIGYALPEASQVHLTIYSVLGQQIRELVNAFQASGTYRVEWNGRDASDQAVSSGTGPYIVLVSTL